MRIKKIIWGLFLYFIIFNVSVYAKSPVWKISKSGNHLFVGGTIHLLSKSDYPLPEAFDSAYDNSAILVLETNSQKLQNPEIQKAFLKNAMYKESENITHFLEPDTVKSLEVHLSKRGIAFKQILKFKPGLLSITLTVIEMQRLGQVGTGVDEFYNLKALNEKRHIKYLEKASAQLEFIAEMGEGIENEFINYTLNDLNGLSLPDILQSLKNAWKNGDNEQMEKIGLDPWKDRFPKIYKSLLIERNNNWISQVKEMMKTKEIELILFGALHLVGKEGILSQLKELGYTIENL